MDERGSWKEDILLVLLVVAHFLLIVYAPVHFFGD